MKSFLTQIVIFLTLGVVLMGGMGLADKVFKIGPDRTITVNKRVEVFFCTEDADTKHCNKAPASFQQEGENI